MKLASEQAAQMGIADQFVQKVKEHCKRFDAFYLKNKQKLKIFGINGRDCKDILEYSKEILADFGNQQLTELWIEWKHLSLILETQKFDPPLLGEDIDNIKMRLKNWSTLFSSLYLDKDITPYIHIVVDHSHQILKSFNSIGKFSQEGFEGSHKWQKTIYFRSTNKDGKVSSKRSPTSSIQQIIQKIFRIYFIKYNIVNK